MEMKKQYIVHHVEHMNEYEQGDWVFGTLQGVKTKATKEARGTQFIKITDTRGNPVAYKQAGSGAWFPA